MFGLVSKKRLMKEFLEIYLDNETSKSTSKLDFYFRSGCANAVDSLCHKFGFSREFYEEVIRRRKEEERMEQEGEQ